MNMELIASELEQLKLQVAAHQAVLRVLVLSAPQSVREDLLSLAQEYDDITLHLPVPDKKREVFSQVLKRLGAPSA